MKLRNKLFTLLIIVIIIPLITGIGITFFSIKRSVETIEIDKAISNVSSVKTFIDSLTSAHGSNYIAWTMWNEYYDAIISRDSEWLNDNILSIAKENTPNEVLIVWDNSGKILAQANAPTDWQKINLKDFKLFSKLNSNTHYTSGLEKTSQGLYIVTLVKVVKSDDESFKNPNGYTIYARKLTNSMITEGHNIMNVNIGLKFNDGNTLSPSESMAFSHNKSDELTPGKVFTKSKTLKDTMVIEAEQIFTDSHGVPIGVLHVETSSKSGVSALSKLFSYSTVLVLLVLGLSTLTLVWIRKYVVTPIEKVTKATEIISNKDLSQNDLAGLLSFNGNDEIAKLCTEFNKMADIQRDIMLKFSDAASLVGTKSDNINGITQTVNSTSQNQSLIVDQFTTTVEQMDLGIQDVTNNISKLTSNVNNVSSAIREIGNTVQDTARSVESAAASINEVSASIEQMGDSIKSIADHSKEAQNEAENTVNKAKEGSITVENTIQEMSTIQKTVTELSEAIKDLGSSAEKIGDIINVIGDISEQTNLLSLNAAIEAARAGDAGKGFAVVASSIRNLAEKSSEATKDISKIIKGIQSDVKNAVVISNDGMDRVKEGVQYISGTGKVFEDIFGAIDKTRLLIDEITTAINQQDASSKEIMIAVDKMNDLVTHLSATAEQQAAGTDEIVRAVQQIDNFAQQVLAATEEQSASSQEVVNFVKSINKGVTEVSEGNMEIATSVSDLDKLAHVLIDVIKEFKLN